MPHKSSVYIIHSYCFKDHTMNITSAVGVSDLVYGFGLYIGQFTYWSSKSWHEGISDVNLQPCLRIYAEKDMPGNLRAAVIINIVRKRVKSRCGNQVRSLTQLSTAEKTISTGLSGLLPVDKGLLSTSLGQFHLWSVKGMIFIAWQIQEKYREQFDFHLWCDLLEAFNSSTKKKCGYSLSNFIDLTCSYPSYFRHMMMCKLWSMGPPQTQTQCWLGSIKVLSSF